MLRSRLKAEDRPRLSSKSRDITYFQAENKNTGNINRSFMTKLGFAAILVLFVFNSWRFQDEEKSELISHMGQEAIAGINVGRSQIQDEKGNLISSESIWTYPRVNRAMLQKLDQIQGPLFAQDGSTPNDASPVDPAFRWRPRITSVPESPRQLSPEVHAEICESAMHPRPCRFLLPLRVAEQESKARIHFSQIVQLAKLLNRTLVLPNVGKSKIGACHKWSFDTYYELDALSGPGGIGSGSLISMSAFREWLEGRPQHIDSQLVSVTPSLPSQIGIKDATYTHTGILVHKIDLHENWRSDFPGCLSSKFQDLLFKEQHIVISVDESVDRSRSEPMGLSIAQALSSSSSEDLSLDEAQVVLLNWDLRHPVFTSLSQLTYSRKMVDIANQLAPDDQYLVVHWRMETIDPDILEDCAMALVDVLKRLLHNEGRVANVSTVWFASDYPYPIAKRTTTLFRPALVAKSGTFRDFEIRHEEAVDILRKSFDQDNEFDGWKLTDIAEALENRGMETELLHDSGVLAILDKLIGIKAHLFVSGSKKCGRTR